MLHKTHKDHFRLFFSQQYVHFLCESKMAIMWPQEPFFYPEEEMMVYNIPKIHINISKRKDTQKNCVLLETKRRK